MTKEMQRLVWNRAFACCEYCRVPQLCTRLSFEIDHVLAEYHGGTTILDNLALACYPCNKYKGAHLAGLDPLTGHIVRLFNPRGDEWRKHFAWNGAVLVGRTAIGRGTVAVLRMNLPLRVDFRQALIDEGVFPPNLD